MTNPPIFYVWIYARIKQKSRGIFVPYATVLELLKRTLPKVTRTLHYPIIKDLEKYKLLKRIDRRKYKIVGGRIDNLLNQYNCPI